MCGRYTSTSPIEVLAEAFAVDEVVAGLGDDGLTPRYNVAPTDPIVAVATRRPGAGDGAGRRVLGTFRWGLVPSWAKDASSGARMINARAEGIADKPAYRSALLRRRCIIPADAFYEWQAPPAGPSGNGVTRPEPAGRSKQVRRSKQPWAFRRRDGAPMAFAGLWEVWRDPADPAAAPLRTATIVTCAANGIVAPVHDRMPVVLDPSAWGTWLDPAIDDRARLLGLLAPAPEGWFDAFPVGLRVNKVDQDGPELLEPLAAG